MLSSAFTTPPHHWNCGRQDPRGSSQQARLRGAVGTDMRVTQRPAPDPKPKCWRVPGPARSRVDGTGGSRLPPCHTAHSCQLVQARLCYDHYTGKEWRVREERGRPAARAWSSPGESCPCTAFCCLCLSGSRGWAGPAGGPLPLDRNKVEKCQPRRARGAPTCCEAQVLPAKFNYNYGCQSKKKHSACRKRNLEKQFKREGNVRNTDDRAGTRQAPAELFQTLGPVSGCLGASPRPAAAQLPKHTEPGRLWRASGHVSARGLWALAREPGRADSTSALILFKKPQN